jgi:hypothetical protein
MVDVMRQREGKFNRRGMPMKNVRTLFTLLCSLGVTVAGLSLVVYAGPCYIQTSTVSALQKGCSETFIYPTGQACPSIVFPNRIPKSPIPTQCGCVTHHNWFGIGTSGNQPSGRMEQGSVTRPCFFSECCTLSGPHLAPGLPIADYIYYQCTSTGRQPGTATASSWEPTGADCPGQVE